MKHYLPILEQKNRAIFQEKLVWDNIPFLPEKWTNFREGFRGGTQFLA